MKTDMYTKAVLTIIAIALVGHLFKDSSLITPAHASNELPPSISTEYALVPISENNTMDVRIVDISTYDEMNVNVKSIDSYDEVKVNVTSIDTSDELDVNIDEIGGDWVSNGGPIKVKID